MDDQVKIIQLRAGRLKKIGRKPSRGILENVRELVQCDGCCIIERTGRSTAEDHLLDRVLRHFYLRHAREANCFARWGGRRGRWKDRRLPSPMSYFVDRQKRRGV